jgi:cobalt-zinc-cadmium resistance protein CzcA
VSDVEDIVQTAVGGKVASELIEGRRRFPIVVRLPARYREDRAAIAGLLLTAPGGERVALSQVADIREVSGPEVVNREDTQRRIVVQSNIRGRDMGSFVAEAQRRIAAEVKLPTGYYITWGGQFENQERAMNRLMLVVPAVLLIIFFLLFSAFGSAYQAMLILLIVPFATAGGIGALWLRGMNLNVSASIGFIAVFGVAILDGVVLISSVNQELGRGAVLKDALREAASTRFRPVVMTSLVASLGFLPMAIATSTGAEIQQPLATVVIGGLVSSTLLTLLVLPVLFPWFRSREQRNSAA